MRTSYPNVLPVQITERIKNISDIYKIANIKLTPINKSYPHKYLLEFDGYYWDNTPRRSLYEKNECIVDVSEL